MIFRSGIAAFATVAAGAGAGPASAEISAKDACEYFARGHFEASNDFEYEEEREHEFGSASLIETSLERYQTWFWQDVSVALFKNETDTKPATFLSTTMTCFTDIKDRRVLEITIKPGLRIGEQIDLPDGDYQFMIAPNPVRLKVGDNVHKGKY